MRHLRLFVAFIVLVGLLCASMTTQAQGSRGSVKKTLNNLAGTWEITYHPNKTVRTYTITKRGEVYFAEEDRRGQITAGSAGLLLDFGTDQKLERLTLGTDGRLFVEHYNPSTLFPDDPDQIGIGRR
jgi:hypothetical protein